MTSGARRSRTASRSRTVRGSALRATARSTGVLPARLASTPMARRARARAWPPATPARAVPRGSAVVASAASTLAQVWCAPREQPVRTDGAFLPASVRALRRAGPGRSASQPAREAARAASRARAPASRVRSERTARAARASAVARAWSALRAASARRRRRTEHRRKPRASIAVHRTRARLRRSAIGGAALAPSRAFVRAGCSRCPRPTPRTSSSSSEAAEAFAARRAESPARRRRARSDRSSPSGC